MKQKLFCCSVAFIMLILISCATGGREFNYTNRSKLLIGKTTRDEAVQLLGEPTKTLTVSNNDGNFETLSYVYAYGNIGGTTARALNLEFRNGLLNGQIYLSGFADDSTDFNSDKSSSIKVSVSSQHDVELIMGLPSGKSLCPSSMGDFKEKCKSGVEVWSWLYMSKTNAYHGPGSRMDISTSTVKSLFITFDKNKIVSDVQRSTKN